MEYYVNWLPSSENTFSREMDFIVEKWNINEVVKFSNLVQKSIIRLAQNPLIGIYRNDINSYSFVISKQTTLFYDIIENKHQIDLLVFWSNLKDPEDLLKLL
ncbi:type II toxin-antitoxin system RelE/ParE family toxin [Flavobacterium sp.]